MAFQPSLSEGETVAGIDPPLNGSGGTGWLSALYLELQLLRRLVEEYLVTREAQEETGGDGDAR